MTPARLAPLLLLAAAGCSPGDGFPELHPLTGTVVRDGKPVTAGGLIFLPEAGTGSGLVVNAHVHPDGTFTAETSRHKPEGGLVVRSGAPAGRYRAVYHPPSDGQRTDLETELEAPVTVGPGTTAVVLTVPAKPPEAGKEPKAEEK